MSTTFEQVSEADSESAEPPKLHSHANKTCTETNLPLVSIHLSVKHVRFFTGPHEMEYTFSCEEYDRSCVEPATEEERSCFMPERCRSDDHWITDNEEDEEYWSPVSVSSTYRLGNFSECTSIAPKLTTCSSSTISSLSEESESECDTPLSCFAPSLQALAEINAQERSTEQAEKGLAVSPSHSRAASPMPTLSPCNSSAASSLASTPSDLQEAGGHYFPSFAIDDDDSVEAYLKARDNAAYDDAMSELVAHQADRAGSRKLGGCNLGVYTKAQLMTDFDCLGGF